MAGESTTASRVADYEEIRPLIELCKAGKVFAVQEWIEAGRPVNPPPMPAKGRRGKTPLEVAIDRGIHSLVEVLLKGGAILEPEGWDSPMNQALKARRLDLVQLLAEHGDDPRSVDMRRVVDTWAPKIMEYFIERGADVELGKPFAYAFCNRIRTAFGVFKQCRQRRPGLQEQANIALRHHCKEGNLKWVSLMLWLGADPCKCGADHYDQDFGDEECGLSAIGFAALYKNFDVFRLKQLRLDVASPGVRESLHYFCKGEGIDILRWLLEKGAVPNDQENCGSSAIQRWLNEMSWTYSFDPWTREQSRKNIDTEGARERMKAIHLLAKHGGRWAPIDTDEIGSARRSLLKLKPDYTVEFIWIMAKYNASAAGCLQGLVSTPSMRAHVKSHLPRIQELISSLS